MATDSTLPPTEAHLFQALLGYADHGIASRVLGKTAGLPHALDADERTRMLLVMLREPKPAG